MTIGIILPGILAECGIDRTAPVITEDSFEMRQVLALMNAAGTDISTRAEWQRQAADVSGASVSSISLPSDFQEMAEDGAVILGDGTPARRVVSPAMWQMLGSNPASDVTFWHIKGGAILFSPAVGSGGVTVRYQTKNWLVGKSAITSNADEAVWPETLLTRATIWRWKRQKGLPYDDVLAEFEADLATAIKADRGVA